MFDIKQKETLLVSIYSLLNELGEENLHLEDIAIKNKELFPTFFTWSKYKENIDLRQVMRSLDQLKRDGFILGSNTKSWTLTQEGITTAEKLFSSIDKNVKPKKFRKGIDFYKREKQRILISDAYQKYSSNSPQEITERDLKYLFRIDGYNSSKDSINRNKERLFKACLGDDNLNNFLNLTIELLKKNKITGELND